MGVTVAQRKGKKGWWLIIWRKNKRTYRFAGHNEKKAKKIGGDVEEALLRGAILPGITDDPRYHLETYYAQWMDQHVKPFRKTSTATSYQLAWEKWIKPALGVRDLRTITRASVRDLAQKMRHEGLTVNSARAMLAPLRALFNRAIDDGVGSH